MPGVMVGLLPEEARATCIVVPAFNEARVIRATVERLLGLGASVVVVDDCSTDGTARELAGLPVTVLRHAVNLGQGAALQTGLDWALERHATYLVTFDADGQHDPADIPPMVRALSAGGKDVVLGSRFLGSAPGISAGRRLLLGAALPDTPLVTGLPLTDVHNGLRAFRAEVAPSLRITQDRMAHASEFLDHVAEARLAWAEAPTTVHYSDYSRGKGQGALGAVDILFELTLGRFRR